MTEHQPDRVWSGIDIPKTVAGVLAALSAAVVGSYLGVAGTLAGAAVASVIGSVGTEIYTRSIHKGRKKLQGTFTAAPAAIGTPPVAAAAATTMALPAMDASTPDKVRWRRVAAVAAALFVLAVGVLTAAELISGRSIADATRGGNGDRSTVSSIIGDKSGNAEKPNKPGVSTPSAPAATTPPAEQPTQQTTEQPTDRPTTVAPTGNSETTAPATGNPGSTGGAGNGSTADNGNGGAAGAAQAPVGVTGSARP